MIKPVSSNADVPFIGQVSSTPRVLPSYECQLSSMNPCRFWAKAGRYLCAFFWLSVGFFKWLCCCEWRKKESPKKTSPPETPKPPEKVVLGPHPTQEKTFRSLICNAQGQWNYPQNLGASNALFQKLGTSGYWSWIGNRKILNKLGKELKALAPHPLEFLYYVFCEKEQTGWIVNFKNQATSFIGSRILSVQTNRDPWEEFISNQEKNFEKHKDDLPLYLEGFCRALNLDYFHVSLLAEKAQWKTLVFYILETRKKEFNIS